MKPIIAITAGDINGVSYEIILKTIFHPHILEICTPVLYGNVAIAKQHAPKPCSSAASSICSAAIAPSACQVSVSELSNATTIPAMAVLNIWLPYVLQPANCRSTGSPVTTTNSHGLSRLPDGDISAHCSI